MQLIANAAGDRPVIELTLTPQGSVHTRASGWHAVDPRDLRVSLQGRAAAHRDGCWLQRVHRGREPGQAKHVAMKVILSAEFKCFPIWLDDVDDDVPINVDRPRWISAPSLSRN